MWFTWWLAGCTNDLVKCMSSYGTYEAWITVSLFELTTVETCIGVPSTGLVCTCTSYLCSLPVYCVVLNTYLLVQRHRSR